MSPDLERTAADAFVEQLLEAGVQWLFGNPGSTEYAVLDSLSAADGLDFVLALHEGVAVSAAAGHARATGRAAAVQLHAGPGLGNGLGMLYNAWAGHTPLVVYVGQSDQAALYLEPTLTADLVALAAPVSKWAYEIRSAEEVPQVLRRAFKVAETPPHGPVVLSLPMDVAEQPCSASVEPPSRIPTGVRPDPEALARAADVLLRAASPVIVVGDAVAAGAAIEEVSRLAALLGAPIFGGSLSEVCTKPDERLWAGRLPFDGSAAERLLADHDIVLAVGTKVLAQIFPLAGAPLGRRQVVHVGLDTWELAKNQPSVVVLGSERVTVQELADRLAEQRTETLAAAWSERAHRIETALEERAQARQERDAETWHEAPASPARAAHEIAAALPPGVTLVDESITAYDAVARAVRLPPAHWFRGRGGGIGEGMGMAVGVQLARPGSPVVALVADGSAIYSLTALWTAAHHGLPVTWVILNNRSYRILKENARRRRAPDRMGLPFVGADLVGPEVDFVSVATGLGVRGVRVTEPDTIADAVREAAAAEEPRLVDVVIDDAQDATGTDARRGSRPQA